VYGIDVDKEGLEKILAQYQDSFTPIHCDLANTQELKLLPSKIPISDVSLLINNAGIGWCGDLIGMPPARANLLIDLNVKSLTELTLSFLPYLIRNKGGLINLSSIAGSYPGPKTAVYNATKAYVTSFTLALYEETLGTGLKVTALIPGHTNTKFLSDSGYPKKYKRGMTPLEVAKYGLRAYEKGVLVAIPGIYNKFDVLLPRILPTKLMLKVANFQLRSAIKREHNSTTR
jgi:uncharacterized protein